MTCSTRRSATRAAALLAGSLAILSVGCGGGGRGKISLFGRSFAFEDANRRVLLSADSGGRFTFLVRDSAQVAAGAGGQGSLSAQGAFSVPSSDGDIVILGTVAGNGLQATGYVQRAGTTLFNFALPLVAPGSATPSNVAGTFTGASGANSAWLTLDSTGHATLWAKLGGIQGGGALALGAGGQLESLDGKTKTVVTASGGGVTLLITSLDGTAVNVTLNLAKTTRAKWTFLVFLNAANDLQPFADLNVNQMEVVGSSPAVNIVLEWKQESCAGCGSPAWLGTRRYYVTKDSNANVVSSQLVDDLGRTVDMGDWRELQRFIAWGQQNYPADRYAVVVWNHGAGWRPTRKGERRPIFPRSVSIDDHTRNEIQIWQLPQALNVVPKVDMLVFDASLMQMTEVAYEIRGSTNYMVGSEESPPGEGFVYDTFLRDLAANPDMSPAQFATQIVNRTLEAYGSAGNNTQSAVDLSKMDALTQKLDGFSVALMAHLGDSAALLRTARNTAESYAYPENKDLYDFAEIVRTGTAASDLRNAATELQTAIRSAVFAERHGALNGNSNGLAIYIPDPIDYLQSYQNLAIARVTGWDTYLQAQPP